MAAVGSKLVGGRPFRAYRHAALLFRRGGALRPERSPDKTLVPGQDEAVRASVTRSLKFFFGATAATIDVMRLAAPDASSIPPAGARFNRPSAPRLPRPTGAPDRATVSSRVAMRGAPDRDRRLEARAVSVSHTMRRRRSASTMAISINPRAPASAGCATGSIAPGPCVGPRRPACRRTPRRSAPSGRAAPRSSEPAICRSRNWVMRRAASRAFQPAQTSTSRRASARSVFRDCFRRLIDACIYMIDVDVEGRNDESAARVSIWPADAGEIAGKTGGKSCRRSSTANCAAAIAETLSFWLTEVGEGFAASKASPAAAR